jgi:6-phosphogluconolactonase
MPNPSSLRIGVAWAIVWGLAGSMVTAADPLLFVASFAPGDKGAIVAYHWNQETGQLAAQETTKGVEHPFFLALSPDQTKLYSIHAKAFGSQDPEQVAAYAIQNRTGGLKLLNRQSTHGTASCSLDVDATGKTLLVANYSTGDIASLPIAADGSLQPAATFLKHQGSSVNTARQKEPHAHCILMSPDNRFALVADLGIDQVLVYKLDPATSQLTPNDPPFVKSPAGAGPRHLVFHPQLSRVYVINELLNTVSVYDYAADRGALTERQTISTLPPANKTETYTADLKITPNGKFLYGTNRGHDSLAAYKIDAEGNLTLVEIIPSRGKGPQNLLISPDGRYLLCANMPGNSLAVFAIDAESGKLTAVGEPLEQLMPSCIMLVP